MRQYEVWWANLPLPADKRPVLLLTREAGYDYLNKFIAAEITTTIRHIRQEVLLGPKEGLSKSCAANLDNLRTISKTALTKRAGELAPGRHVEVRRALGYALGWRELMDT